MGKFKVNDRVMARWPGSTLWFEGSVVDLNDIEYQIRFSDEGNSEYVVKYKDVKSLADFTRKRSKSRGRSRSRGRPAAKSRSPARKTQSPGRPAQKEAERVIEKSVSVKKTLTSVTSVEPEAILLDDKLSEPTVRPRLTRADLFAPRTSTPTRQSLRLANKDTNDIDGQMNNVKADVADSKVAARKSSAGLGSKLCGLTSKIGVGAKKVVCAIVPALATVKTFVLMVIMLAMPFLLNEACTKKRCTIKEFPPMPKPVAYYDLQAVVIVGGYLASQLLLYFLPLGRVLKTRNGSTVRRNGWLAMVLSMSVLPLLMYLEYDVVQVYGKYRQLLATTMALGVLISLAAYIRGAYVPNDAKNPLGKSGLILPDFFTGRELNPSVGRIDLKFFIFRTVCIAWMLINEIIVIKDLQASGGKYNTTLLVACALQLLYAADWMFFEDTYLTTYEYVRQGFGFFMHIGNFSMVFTLPIFTRLILNYKNDLEWYYLALIVSLNILGYTITRGANSQKHAFRTNPSDPALAHLESIPTAAGTRLLVSGWWGFVRHPNYLGDILVFTSWALLCGFNFALPWLMVGLDALFLVARTYEVEAACKKKYGSLWGSYTSRVRYRLIPKVF